MQNYRKNAMPYNTYRQMQSPSCMNNSRMEDNCAEYSRMGNAHMQGSRMGDSCMDSRNTVDNVSLAMAYVPWQTWRDIYDAEKGFHRGTIFEELDLPFTGKGGSRR